MIFWEIFTTGKEALLDILQNILSKVKPPDETRDKQEQAVGAAFIRNLRDLAPRSDLSKTHAADRLYFTVTRHGDSSEITAHARPGFEYLFFTTVRTRPHVIRGTPLTWLDMDMTRKFAFTVHHPGTKGSNWVDRAIDRTKQ